MESPIVTLTTDWGDSDYFGGMVKGKLYSYIPGVRVVDISHNIDPYQVKKAAFVVKHACTGFPKGTIHIIDICSSETAQKPFVVVEREEQYYICIDNGLPDAALGREGTKAVLIDVPQETEFFSFAASDLFCKVAAMLAQGATLADIGAPYELNRSTQSRPDVSSDIIKLSVASIDNYGNACLNMSYEEFERLRKKRPFTMMVRDAPINKLCHSYVEVDAGKLLLTVSATRLLQVAVRQGSAEQLFGLESDSSVIVKFLEENEKGR